MIYVVTLLYIVFLVMLFFVLTAIFLELFQDFIFGKVPFVPTNRKTIKVAIDNIENSPKVIYDLGAGDGRFLIDVSKKYPNAKIIGFEKSWWPFLFGRFKIFLSRANVKLYRRNLFVQNISDADLVFCFLGDKQMEELEIMFEQQLRPGCIIIANTFGLPSWKETKFIEDRSQKTRWGNIIIYQK